MANELYCDNFIMSEDGENFEMTQTTKGDPGEGVPTGGTAGQFLKKSSDTDYDTEWADINAGDVGYDPDETYQSGTVGKELADLSNEVSEKQDAPATAGTAGQVLGLDDQLQPVWTDGGSSEDAAPVIINTASGDIASFSDGADDMPIRKLVANIEPVQDLHGYDNPWPAGGGVNQWDEDWENGYYDRNTGAKGGNSNTTYFRSKNYIPCAPNTSYYFKAPSVHASNATYFAVLFYDADKSFISASNTDVGNTARTTPQNAQFMTFYIEVGTSGATYQNDIAINYPATVTTYSPYSNICPISGWTGAEIEQTGVNIWDEEWEIGGISNITGANTNSTVQIRSKNYTLVKPGMRLYIKSTNQSGTAAGNLQGRYYDKDKQYLGANPTMTVGTVITIPEDCCYIRFSCQIPYGTTYNHDISINYPSTDTEYHPYTGNQISVNWEDEAGTVYGGTLTINPDRTGELVVDRVKVTIDGDTVRFNGKLGADNVAVPAVQLNLFGLPASAAYNNQIASNYLKKWTTAIATEPNTFNASGNLVAAHINDIVGFGTGQAYTTLSELLAAANSYVSENNLEIIYLLATSVTYQLTESEISGILSTLYGTNNIWSDTGDTEVTYPCDTKLYIDGKIAEAIAALNS